MKIIICIKSYRYDFLLMFIKFDVFITLMSQCHKYDVIKITVIMLLSFLGKVKKGNTLIFRLGLFVLFILSLCVNL